MPPPRPPLSSVLPPLVLGTATFNNQYNPAAHRLPTTAIIHRALAAGIAAFDTSPYYGPAEKLLGAALLSSGRPRSSYHLLTKVGRLAAAEFDYSPSWIRASVARSLARLHTTYLDVVYCHDVEFVSADQVLRAVAALRELRDEGAVRYVGISGYPLDVLVALAMRVRAETGEPLDAVMGYAHYSLQNTALAAPGGALARLVREAGVGVVLSGSPLGMGLLRRQGVPVGAMGDFHPAPQGLRRVCMAASRVAEEEGGQRLERVALAFALEGWSRDGAEGGTEVGAGGEGRKIGVSVAGVSYLHELEELLEVWGEVVRGVEKRVLWERVQAVFETGVEGDERWRDYSWESPGADFKRESKL